MRLFSMSTENAAHDKETTKIDIFMKISGVNERSKKRLSNIPPFGDDCTIN